METIVQQAEGVTASVNLLGNQVQVRLPAVDRTAPFTVIGNESIDVMAWAAQNKEPVNQLLLQYGALLLRGFAIDGARGFNDLFSILAGNALEYKNRTSPRDQVFSNVYTSTNHPSDQVIHMHTENSYSKSSNRIISFFCLVPPGSQGETPIADERELLRYLKEETKEKFRTKQIQYVRNVFPGIGLDLKTIYQTDNKDELAVIFDKSGVSYEWVTDNHLRLKWVLPAFLEHPVTKEEVWFNHMYFGHKSLYDEQILEVFDEEDLPFVTYYGDGSTIEDSVIQEFKDFYASKSIVFPWQQHDFLLLDNMMYSHGRSPYTGARTILTAMGQPVTFS